MPLPTWEEYRRQFPDTPEDTARHLYQQAQLLDTARAAVQPTGAGGYALRRSVPFVTPLVNTVEAQEHRTHEEHIATGSLNPRVFERYAQLERQQQEDADRQASWAGSIGDVAARIPAILGEGYVGGAALRAAGVAAPAVAEAPSLFSRAGVSALVRNTAAAATSPAAYGRTALQTAAMPSMYLEDWAQRGGRAQDLPPAFLTGAINTAILGGVGAGRGNLAQRIFRGVPVGMLEQQAADAVGSAVSEFLPDSMRLQTGYGLIGQVARGGREDALKHALGQALMFGVFAGIHGGDHRAVPREAAETSREAARAGYGRNEAAARVQEVVRQAVESEPAPENAPGSPRTNDLPQQAAQATPTSEVQPTALPERSATTPEPQAVPERQRYEAIPLPELRQVATSLLSSGGGVGGKKAGIKKPGWVQEAKPAELVDAIMQAGGEPLLRVVAGIEPQAAPRQTAELPQPQPAQPEVSGDYQSSPAVSPEPSPVSEPAAPVQPQPSPERGEGAPAPEPTLPVESPAARSPDPGERIAASVRALRGRLAELMQQHLGGEQITAAEFRPVIEQADMPDAMKRDLLGYLSGKSQEAVGRDRGVTKQAVGQNLADAAKKMGLQDVSVFDAVHAKAGAERGADAVDQGRRVLRPKERLTAKDMDKEFVDPGVRKEVQRRFSEGGDEIIHRIDRLEETLLRLPASDAITELLGKLQKDIAHDRLKPRRLQHYEAEVARLVASGQAAERGGPDSEASVPAQPGADAARPDQRPDQQAGAAPLAQAEGAQSVSPPAEAVAGQAPAANAPEQQAAQAVGPFQAAARSGVLGGHEAAVVADERAPTFDRLRALASADTRRLDPIYQSLGLNHNEWLRRAEVAWLEYGERAPRDRDYRERLDANLAGAARRIREQLVPALERHGHADLAAFYRAGADALDSLRSDAPEPEAAHVIPDATRSALGQYIKRGDEHSVKYWKEILENEFHYDRDHVNATIRRARSEAGSPTKAPDFKGPYSKANTPHDKQHYVAMLRNDIRGQILHDLAPQEVADVHAEAQRAGFSAAAADRLAGEVARETQAEVYGDQALEAGGGGAADVDVPGVPFRADAGPGPSALPGEPGGFSEPVTPERRASMGAAAADQAEPPSAGAPAAAVGNAPQAAPASSAASWFQRAKDFLASFAQKAFPAVTRLSRESGEKLAQAANAPDAAHATWEYMSNVLKVGTKRVAQLTDAEAQYVGAVWLERRFRHFAAELRRRGENESNVRTLVGVEGSPLKAEADFRQGVENLWSFFEAVRQEWTPEVEKNFKGLMGIDQADGIDSKSQIPGLPLNAIAMKTEDVGQPGVVGTGRKQGMQNLRLRRPGFTREATLAADAYDIDVRHMMQRSLNLGVPAARRAEFVRAAVDAGVLRAVGGNKAPPEGSYDYQANGRYFTNKPDQAPPPGWHHVAEGENVPRGQAVLERDVRAPEGFEYLALDPARGLPGLDPNASYYAHKDAYQEVKQGLGIGERPGEVLNAAVPVRAAMDKLYQVALMSPVELSTHVANHFTALFKPGMGVPFANLGETIRNAAAILKRDPAVLEKLKGLADIGAWFHHEARPGILGEKLKAYDPTAKLNAFTAKFIETMQGAVRLQLADAYDRVAGSGDFPRTETAKRDFVNQALGNYSSRSGNVLAQFLKDTGLQSFATAAHTMTTQAVKNVTGGAVNAPTTSAEAGVRLRAAMLVKFLPFLAAGPALNAMLWGQPFPQGVPAFAIQTRRDEDGAPHWFDPLYFTGLRRGARATGINALVEAAVQGDRTAGEVVDRMARDAELSLEHLFAGPPAQLAHTALTGRDATGRQIAPRAEAGQSQALRNVGAAAAHVNPIAGAFAEPERHTQRTLVQTAMGQLGPFGERSGRDAVDELASEFGRLQRLRQAAVRRGEANRDVERRYQILESAHRTIQQLDHAAAGLVQTPQGLVQRQVPPPDRVRELRARQVEIARRLLDASRR